MDDRNIEEIIKEARISKNITAEKVFEDTFMPVKFIDMIEGGRWREFQSEAHLKGYLRLYSSYLRIEKNLVEKKISELSWTDPDDKAWNRNEAVGTEKKPFFSSAEKRTIFMLAFLALIFLVIFFMILYILPG